eukprot:scaffold21802_cov132-Isochrysis_galbana.AAC.3
MIALLAVARAAAIPQGGPLRVVEHQSTLTAADQAASHRALLSVKRWFRALLAECTSSAPVATTGSSLHASLTGDNPSSSPCWNAAGSSLRAFVSAGSLSLGALLSAGASCFRTALSGGAEANPTSGRASFDTLLRLSDGSTVRTERRSACAVLPPGASIDTRARDARPVVAAVAIARAAAVANRLALLIVQHHITTAAEHHFARHAASACAAVRARLSWWSDFCGGGGRSLDFRRCHGPLGRTRPPRSVVALSLHCRLLRVWHRLPSRRSR